MKREISWGGWGGGLFNLNRAVKARGGGLFYLNGEIQAGTGGGGYLI